MEFKQLIERAKEIREVNAELAESEGSKAWGLAERTQGFVGDVGDLAKLVMAKNGYRKYGDLDQRLRHELADCLWSVIIIADEAGVDLEAAFVETMKEIELRKK
ncbi:MAG: MazG nucleotide pyrophosphohydrolase domain-containing protein [Patescibacteria group bacterium]|jgi:NTP pyrophosphatase (non-canonical NTP hydrolase)